MKKSDNHQDQSEDKKSYLKKMRKLADDLSELRKYHSKQDKKLAAYEAKLKKIDDKLNGL